MPDHDGVYRVTDDEMREEIEALRGRAVPTPPHPIRADLERAVSLIAEQVRAGAPRRATGTELAAMRLALGMLRASAARIPRYGTRNGAALDAITCATDALAYGSYSGRPELWRMSGQARAATLDPRAVRARLALYLRARLRMERGDDGGRWECESCGDRETGGEQLMDHLLGRPMRPSCCNAPRSEWTTRITPLWQLARGTEASGG